MKKGTAHRCGVQSFDARGLYPRGARMGIARKLPRKIRKGVPDRTPFLPPSGGGPARHLTHNFLATTELTEELLHRRRQCIVVQPVDHVLTLALVDDQLRLLEHRQVTGDRRLGKIEIPNDLADRALAPFEKPQDLLSCAVRQSLEDFGQMPFLTSEVMGDAVQVCHVRLSPSSGLQNHRPPSISAL